MAKVAQSISYSKLPLDLGQLEKNKCQKYVCITSGIFSEIIFPYRHKNCSWLNKLAVKKYISLSLPPDFSEKILPVDKNISSK